MHAINLRLVILFESQCSSVYSVPGAQLSELSSAELTMHYTNCNVMPYA